MWQEIVVICIGILTLTYSGWKVYGFIRSSQKGSSPCGGCSGCSINDDMKKLKNHCPH